MKKERLLLIISCLCFCFIFNLNKEAFATSKNEGGDKSPFMESFMQNMEVDLRLSYGFYMHHHYEMKATELTSQSSSYRCRNRHFGKYMHTKKSYQRLGFKIDFHKHIYGMVTMTVHQGTSPTS